MTTTTAAWRLLAACATVDPELFFPTEGQPVDAAIRVCADCPVRLDCLDDALAWESLPRNDAHGVWGGLTVTQRNAIRGINRGGRPTMPCPECDTPTVVDKHDRPRLCGLCLHHQRRTA